MCLQDCGVAQVLMGTTVKILTCTVVVKEVSSCTVGGGEKSVRGGGGDARGTRDRGLAA